MPIFKTDSKQSDDAENNWQPFGIESRQQCAATFLERRLSTLAERLNRHKPKLVILYGVNYTRDIDVAARWKRAIRDANHGEDIYLHTPWEPDVVEWAVNGHNRRSHFQMMEILRPDDRNTLLVCTTQPTVYLRRGGNEVPNLLGL